jgi:nucleoside-diphosphate-sugar epimerase
MTPPDEIVKILVTGASGFVGVHLVREIAARGLNVVACTFEPPSEEALARIEGVEALVTWAELDVRSKGLVETVLREHDVDTILHAAAVTSAPGALNAIAAVNVEGTRHMLGAAVRHSVRRFVFLSSGAVYGDVDASAGRIGEDHPLKGDNPYARSKMAAEVLSRDYACEHDLSVSIARLGTLYGPVEGRSPYRLKPSIPWRLVELALENRSVRVFGLATKRPYSFVDDAARALVDLALTRPEGGDTFHVGSEESVAFSRLLDIVGRLRPEVRFEPVDSIAEADLSMKPEDARPVLDGARLESVLGPVAWRSVGAGLEQLMDWRAGLER